MPPGIYDFDLYEGEGLRKVLQWKRKNGLFVPTEFWSFICDIRQEVGASTALAELTTANGGVTISLDGVITLYIAPADTVSWNVDTAVYDVVGTYALTGDKKHLIKGTITYYRRVSS